MEWYYLMDHILYQDYFEYIIKKHEILTYNSPVRIYLYKFENRITFNVKTVYYLGLLTPKTMKLLKSSYKKITKEKNCENIPYLEMAEKKLVHCNITDNDYQQSQNSCIYLFQISCLGNWLRFYGKIYIFRDL